MNPHQHQLEKSIPLLFGKSRVDGISLFKQLLIFVDAHGGFIPIGGLGESVVVHVFYFPNIGELGEIIEQLRHLSSDTA